jgi:hypothetical protein
MSILTEEEKIAKYDAERAGTIYTLAPITSLATPCDTSRQRTPKSGDELPFGQLRDGTPITGVYDKDEPGGRSGIVHAYVGHMLLTAQEGPSLFSITNHRLEDMTIEQVNAIRAILNTDIPEQLLAAAIAHRNGDETPTASREDLLIGHIDGVPVLASYLECGKLYSAHIDWQGIRVSTDGTDYINLPDHASLSTAGDFRVCDWQVLARANVISRLVALAQAHPSYPPMLPALGGAAVCLSPAIRVGYVYHDPDEGGDLTEKPVGPLAWVDYECGEGDARARISFGAESEPYRLSTAFAGHADIGLEAIERAIRNMQALLDDPRVKAARAEA